MTGRIGEFSARRDCVDGARLSKAIRNCPLCAMQNCPTLGFMMSIEGWLRR